MAESEGFEPPIDLRLCLISSQVHSTGLCQLSAFPYFISGHRLAAPASRTTSIATSFEDLSSRRPQHQSQPWGEELWQSANGPPSFSNGSATKPLRQASTPP